MRPLLLLVLALGLVAPSSARASCPTPVPPVAQIDRAYRFDASLAAHYPTGGPAAEAIGSPTFEAARGRQVLDADAGDGVRVATAGTSRETWSVVLDVRLDQNTPGEQRILGLSGNDSGVYAKDGRLVVATGSSRSDAGALPPAGQWFQLALSDGLVGLAQTSVHLDGAQRAVDVPLALGDHVQAFKDDGAEDGAGQLAGLRLFSNALGSALAHVGSPDDLAPPTPHLEVSQAPGAFMMARPHFFVSGEDGGRPANRVGLRLVPPGPGSTGDVPLNHRTPGNGQGEAPWEMSPLPDGAQYDLQYSAVDYAGNVTTGTSRRTVDGRAPSGLSIDTTPERTSDTTPLISGRTAVAPGDDPHVLISITRRVGGPVARAACTLPPPVRPSERIEAAIGPDGGFSAESRERYAVGDVLEVAVTHFDHVRNAQWLNRTITIVAPPAVAPDRRRFLERVATALGRQLRKISRRSLARRRGAAVTVDADGPGALRVELRSRGRRPAVLSRVTATFRKAGRRRVRLRPTLAGRRALLRATRLTVRLTYVPRGERAVVRSKALTLRR